MCVDVVWQFRCLARMWRLIGSAWMVEIPLYNPVHEGFGDIYKVVVPWCQMCGRAKAPQFVWSLMVLCVRRLEGGGWQLKGRTSKAWCPRYQVVNSKNFLSVVTQTVDWRLWTVAICGCSALEQELTELRSAPPRIFRPNY